MIINLFEINEDGKNFKYSDETAEITTAISDLIGTNKYQAEFSIRPLNSRDFELKGWIKTRTKEICSYCGQNIQFPVQSRFHEILIPPQELTRDGKYSKANHFSELDISGPDSLEYSEQMKFDIGEYLHEAIALIVPYNPSPTVNEKNECSDCGLNIKDFLGNIEEKTSHQDLKENNPFASLKSIKIEKH
ncbi:MAG: YceD family protein [Bdellovibrionaceae bacterium]|nr:YceD family protein [Pseudobdellovibrionaceae bacterium]NUM58200.1 DUF177 domain-containing protein [Pseudobdellovibrionaceae bacterium]